VNPAATEQIHMPTPAQVCRGSNKDRATIAESEQRFPRTARLLAKVQFDAAFADGRRCASRFFRATVTSASGADAALGLAVSRRVSKLAVQRNRLKRQVRESFRHARQGLPALNVVVSAKPEAVAAANSALQQDLAKLWQRIAALKAPTHSGTMRGAC
jgi:ribonuclease P protein component